ncbi:hypothetical protein BJ165DRAFT_1487366 [Panaeolus papilionaceus]|nr:hypothetical protein BJ165DRAFT_1487366 [Panaeolus papilionaceus]
MVDEGDESVEATPSKPPPPEPESLAKKIQDLIDSMPFPQPGEGKSIPIVKNPKPPARDKDGRPIPPPNATPVKDSKLLAFLSSATIMNGSDTGRRSIWSVLESLGVPPHGFPPTNDKDEERTTPPDSGEGGHDTDGDGSPDIFADTSSVMVYSPLIPDRKDLVELAELVDLEGNSVDGGSSYPVAGTSWGQVWPLSAIWNSSSIANASGDTSPVIHRVSSEVVISGTRTGVDGNGNPVRIRTARAWVPSDTKLSVQAMWWGYRLYLPPPVLEILDDKTLEATKRAAMITTALTWFFNNLPINSLPIAVRPALLLLQRIAPFVGYIGTFISWSWKTVKSYDVGFGVTLTATWLLPIALIPGTWNEYDFPKSPSPASPIPLPPRHLLTLLRLLHRQHQHLQILRRCLHPHQNHPHNYLHPHQLNRQLHFLQIHHHLLLHLPFSHLAPLQTQPPASPLNYPTYLPPIAHTAASRPPLSALDTSASGPHSPTPPVPMEVPPSSPLAKRLLQGPMMNPVPLPDENAPMPKFKERVRGVFKKRQNVDLN